MHARPARGLRRHPLRRIGRAYPPDSPKGMQNHVAVPVWWATDDVHPGGKNASGIVRQRSLHGVCAHGLLMVVFAMVSGVQCTSAPPIGGGALVALPDPDAVALRLHSLCTLHFPLGCEPVTVPLPLDQTSVQQHLASEIERAAGYSGRLLPLRTGATIPGGDAPN